MTDVSKFRVIILVFGMPGCHACEDYVPRLRARAAALKKSKKTFLYENGKSLPDGVLPIFIYDVNSENKPLQALADQYKIEAMPTTIVLVRPSGARRFEGALSDTQIDHVLTEAAQYI